jgi:spore coat protein A
VTYLNKLVDGSGAPLASYLPVDTTLDWANPGAIGGLAPVPLVAHLHGGDSQYKSDGLPDAWSTPGDEYTGRLFSKPYTYDNTQEAGHLWYHDHALGVTRTNVYMGLAGNYFIRDLNELLLVAQNKLPAWPYEVPLAIQDRMFSSDGTLRYPSAPREYPAAPEGADPNDPNDAFFSALEAATPTSHFPEFFGDIMLVNGKAWPKLDVEPRQYRFRVLNGSDSRVYTMKLAVADPVTGAPTATSVPFFVIGNELGLLNTPAVPSYADPRDPTVQYPNVLAVAPGERYDIVVDFQALNGQKIIMTNAAAEPFPDGDPAPESTLQIMRFDVVKRLNRLRPRTTLTAITDLRPNGALPAPDPATATLTRRIVLVEGTDGLGRLMTLMGPVDAVANENGTIVQGTLTFKDAVTERPAVGSTEIWEFYNTTVDAHPIHMHLVDFRILNRETFDPNTVTVDPKAMQGGIVGGILRPDTVVPSGVPVPPAPEEAGKKDTAIMYPGTVTRLLVSFKRKGEYVYHCHILSHEDHEMMRPYEVQ